MPVVDPSLCIGCGACADICPSGAIAIRSIASIDEGACLMCNACISECPESAIAPGRPSSPSGSS